MNVPFNFRLRPNLTMLALAAFFAARNTNRDIDPDGRNHQGSGSGHGHSKPHPHVISKRERKRREHIRRINPHRTH